MKQKMLAKTYLRIAFCKFDLRINVSVDNQ